MKRYRRAMALILSAVMICSLAACGGKEDTQKQEAEAKEYTYVAEYMDVAGKEGESVNFYRSQVQNGFLYYTSYSYDEASDTSSENLCEYSLDEKKVVRELDLIGGQTNRNINDYRVSGDGSIYTLEYAYNEDYSDQKILLCIYDTQGNRTAEQDITDTINDGSEYAYVEQMLVDGENRIYLCGNQKIFLFDGDGQARGIISLDTWMNGMSVGSDGKVYGCYYDQSSQDGSYCLAEIDFDGRKMGTVYNHFPSGNNVTPGTEKDFLISSSSSVYRYDLNTCTYEKLFDWLDSDINGTYVESVSAMEDGRIAVLIQDWETNDNSIALLTRKRTADLPKKSTITIGTLGISQDLQAAAVKFNKQSDTYRVTVKNYMDENSWSEDSYKNAITGMNNDITSGSNCPDIIDLSSVNVEQLSAKGVFEDLTPYLEKSAVLDKEDYLENVLDSYTFDGKLIGIPYSFYIITVVGKTSDLGAEPGWSLEEMMAYSEAHPGAALFDGAVKNTILYYCLAYNQDQFIDYSTGTCKYDSREFKDILTFAAGFPDEYDWQADDRSTPLKMQAGEVLLDAVSIDDFESIQPYEAMFNEPVTFIGFPNSDGSNGCMLNASGAYAISSKAKNKEGAWAFIESYLNREAGGMFSWGFSSRKSVLEAKIEEVTNVTYLTDEKGELILDEDGNPIPEGGSGGIGYGDWEFDYHPVTREEVDIVMGLMEGAKPAASMDNEIMTIILEETEPFFRGQKTVDDVAGIIQSRIQLYVNENQ